MCSRERQCDFGWDSREVMSDISSLLAGLDPEEWEGGGVATLPGNEGGNEAKTQREQRQQTKSWRLGTSLQCPSPASPELLCSVNTVPVGVESSVIYKNKNPN